MYGGFVWARRALKHRKRRFPARAANDADAVVARGECEQLPLYLAAALQEFEQDGSLRVSHGR